MNGDGPESRTDQRIVFLFIGSGCASLIYEVIWLQLLQLVIGASAVSVGVLLGTFMGGLCLGSLLVPPVIGRRRHPLHVFAALEMAVAACGLLLVWTLPHISDLYELLGGGHIALRIAIACVCLLPPTIAMGATLPIAARAVPESPAGVASLGVFYLGNLMGAVGGTLLAGFYLLQQFDVNVATYVAAIVNIAVAAAAWRMGRRAPNADQARPASTRATAPRAGTTHVVTALSGFTALSAEVLWTRLLSLAFGATVYTFSLILAAFLVGLGLGSAAGAALARRRSPRAFVALGWCQIGLCAAMAFASYVLTQVLPYWPLADAIAADPWRTFEHDLLGSFLVVLPAAILWGASLPLAIAAGAADDRDVGRVAGRVLAANTAGAIVGALGTSVLLANAIGSQHVQQLLIGVAAIAGLLALSAPSPSGGVADLPSSAAEPARRLLPSHDARSPAGPMRPGLWIGLATLVVVLVPTVAPVPASLIAYGRRSAEWVETARIADAGRIVYAGEGVNDFIAVSRGAEGEWYYHAAGKVQASTQPQDMRLQLLLAHLSHLLARTPANVLVIGCGAGITAGAISIGPGVTHMTIADIEPLVPKVAAAYFGDVNHHVLQDPRISVRVDDGRHLLATTRDTFDVITTDLIDPWVKGVAALFTREFFELAKRHLRPGGVVTQFVQLYQSSPEAVKSEIGTFVEAFPNAIVWGNPHEGQGYDLVLLGQVEPTRIDIDELEAKLAQPAFAPVRDSLRTIGIESARDLLSTYAASATDLRSWLADAAISSDRNLRLQYLAGLGLNRDENGPIYDDILKRATFPAATFTGTAATVQLLRTAIERHQRRGTAD